MTAPRFPIYVGENAISRMLDFCDSNQFKAFTLVVDDNTFTALGKDLESALNERQMDVNTILLSGEEVIADERYIVQVMVDLDRENRVFIAVGSGTITDITRFVAYRTKSYFISMPTAPSVDGYTSLSSSLTLNRLKTTVNSFPPLAIYADLPVLCAAPHRLIAAGFGDLIAKYTSTADWRLGHLLWDEPYDEAIANRSLKAADDAAARVDEVSRASEDGVRAVMDGLIETGLCMLDFGESRPASGLEHHISHFWESRLLEENRPGLLHGAKVGVACVIVTSFWDQVKQLSRQDAARRMKDIPQPDRSQEIEYIKAAYRNGPLVDFVIARQRPYLDMSQQEYASLQQKILDNWSAIQDIAAQVPSSKDFESLLRKVGGPTRSEDINLTGEDVTAALGGAHYFRERFTIAKLNRFLGIQ